MHEDPMACANVALRARYGQGGVTIDLPPAAKAYTTACDVKLGTACFEVALLYDQGFGVGEDEARALTLYEQAFEPNDQYLWRDSMM